MAPTVEPAAPREPPPHRAPAGLRGCVGWPAVTRYVVIGAGAVGGGIGGRLAAAGIDVVLVARGDHLAALQADGLRLRTPEEDLRLAVTAVGGPEELRLEPDDVLVLATKTHQATAALAQWADAPVRGGGTAGERLPVLTALNGVASERMAMRYFARVYAVCVWMPTVHLTPGEVIVRSTPTAGVFHVGRVPTAEPPDDAFLAEVAEQWRAARLDTHRPPDVMAWKYRKLITNIGNAFQALVGQNGRYGDLVQAAEREAREVLDRAGISYTSDEEEAATRAASFTIAPVPGTPEMMGGSSWQSLARGTGSIETDYLNGEIVLLAHAHGTAAPLNTTVASLARQAAAAGRPPGSLSADQLRGLLGL